MTMISPGRHADPSTTGSRGRLFTRRPSNCAIAFGLAVLLPAIAAAATYRYPPLHAVPFALHYMAMALVAVLGGFYPALLSVGLSTAATFTLLPEPHGTSHDIVLMLFRPVVLLASAATISVMTRGQRHAAAALQVALANLREQAVALADSQQASKCAAWTYIAGDRTRWYPGGYEVFGIPAAELDAMSSPIPLIWPEDQPIVTAAVRKMVAERSSLRVEYRVLFPNGELHWCEARGNPIEGQPGLWRGVTFDITERKLAEAALVRSEKLAAVGRLASTIAHEINNPLEAVTNLLYLARADRSLSPATDDHLAVAERELARVAEIARLALGFIRTSVKPRNLEVVDAIEDVLALYRHRFEMKNVQIERQYEPGVVVRIAPQEIRQIATNLISNALDASAPAAGQSCARVAVRVLRETGASAPGSLETDRAVLIVEDTGTGIAPAHIHRIFDPFFTTKEETGTGIGLWVTREFVEKNGGTIAVKSGNLPNGVRTSFRVELPARPVPEAAIQPEPSIFA
jgi:PAS domain S-box-containing protein